MRALIVFLLLVLSLSTTYAQEEEPPWAGMQQVLIPTGIPATGSSQWVSHFAVSGDTAFVSVPGATYGGYSEAGLVTVFKFIEGHWIQQEMIWPPEGELWDNLHFGRRISADGNYLVIQGAQKCVESRVSSHRCVSPGFNIYVYIRSGDEWVLDGKITDLPDIEGEPLRVDGGFIDGETVIVEGSREIRDDLVDTEGEVFLFNRIDGVWTLTGTFSNDPNDPYKFSRALGLSLDGNTLLLGSEYRLYIFRRNMASWGLSAVINIPLSTTWKKSIAALNDRGDTIAVLHPRYFMKEGPSYSLYIYRFNGSVWNVVFTDSLFRKDNPYGLPAIAFNGDTLVFGGSDYAARIYKEIDGNWKHYSIVPAFIQNPQFRSNITLMALDGEHLLRDMGIYKEGDVNKAQVIWALKIPGIRQDVPETIGRQSKQNILPLPDAPSGDRDTASDYYVFHVALKTRPTETVKFRLKTTGDALLDTGGIASAEITLKFTRDNWNIPHPVRVRLAPGQSGPLSAVIKEKIIDGSAYEYTLINPIFVRVELPGITFAPEVPAADAILLNDSPVTLTWRPYSLATRYVVKLKRVGSTRVFKYPVDPASACTVDLCTLTLDRAALPKGKALKWRVVAKDQPAAYQRATPWRKFNFTVAQ